MVNEVVAMMDDDVAVLMDDDVVALIDGCCFDGR